MKPHSHFQPTRITDQDRHIFRVWEQRCLSSLVPRSFLLCFPTGGFFGQQSDSPPPSLAQAQLLRVLGFHRSGSQPAWAGGCREQQSHPSSRSHRGCRRLPGVRLAGSRAGCCPPLLTLQPPSPLLPLFLTRVGVSVHPVASFFCQ